MKSIYEFNEINLNDNNYFSSMDFLYLNLFLRKMNNYYLEYRELLNFSSDFTFGVEIEIENIQWLKFYNIEDNSKYYKWQFIRDDSLDNGKEIVSSPLINKNETWKEMFDLLNELGECATILSNCGGHIHIGAHLVGNDFNNYINLLKLWAAYENIIYRFGYGEYISPRKFIMMYSSPILNLVKNYLQGKNSIDLLFHNPMQGLNYVNIKKEEICKYNCFKKDCTLEVRNCNGSLNPVIWQNNINFFVKLFLYAKNKNFNEELILKRLNSLFDKACSDDDCQKQLDIYNQIDLESAIELADLIFDKNIDKVYFLRQYVKNYEIGKNSLEKGKKFTKSINY